MVNRIIINRSVKKEREGRKKARLVRRKISSSGRRYKNKNYPYKQKFPG